MLCHVVLGVALGIAPIAVWVALTDTIASPSLLLGGAVATWVAGFDMIYSCQDAAFDREHGLYSAPAVLGLRGALIVSALLHVATVMLLALLPWFVTLGPAYWGGVGIIAVVLAYEHAIVSPEDLSRIDKAFFDLNGCVSLLFFAAVVAA
jgi:4-hydroxybenzoate polyprenyltransferase